MTERRCQACGVIEQSGANFCSQCGVASDAEYVDLDQDRAVEVLDVGRPRLSKVLVPLGVFALLGMLVLALLGAGGGGDEPEEARRAEPATPQPVPSATPTAAPTATPKPTPRPTPSATPVLTIAPANLGDLPDTDATHLAVAYRSTVHFLDLRTGTWTQTDVGRRIRIDGDSHGGLNAFGAGVLVDTESSGGTSFVPLNGNEVTLLGGRNSGLMAVSDNVAFIQDYSDDVQTVLAVNPDGDVLYELSIEPQMWAAGVTTDGRVVVQAGTTILLVDDEGGESLGTGVLRGVKGNKVILFDCSALTDCRSEVVDVITGERTALGIGQFYFESRPNGDLISYGSSGDATAYHLIDGELVKVEAAETESGPDRGLGFATDAAGLSARVVANQIEFIDDVGAVLTSIPFTPNICCDPPFGVTFIYADS